MTDPLELSRARVARAREHAERLAETIATPSVNRSDIASRGRYPVSPPPAQVCMMVGEIVYNLRLALDHLVWGLTATTDHETPRHLGFPICDTPEQFKQVSHGGMLSGVPRKYYPLIAGVQPYLAPDPGNSILKLLAELAHADARGGIAVSLTRDPSSGAAMVIFDRIGSHERAAVLVVLSRICDGVQDIIESFQGRF